MFAFRSIYFDDEPVQGHAMDIFESNADVRDTAIFFIHGGGWTGGSRSNYHFVMHALASQGFDCASTDYRLSGVNVFEQVADVRTGLDYFVQDLARRNRPANVVLVGGSAGGHLALLAGLAKPQECGQPPTELRHPASIQGIIVEAAPFTFEPWEDIFPVIWKPMQNIVGVPFEKRPDLYLKASPIHYVRPNMPPVFSMHASHEDVFPIELAEAFSRKVSEVNGSFRSKVYPRTEHGFFYSFERWQQREAYQDILNFLSSL